ncbi:MAG: hypothetical protein ABRQ38_18915 [Candidatus Eremiobacterota bacterium]
MKKYIFTGILLILFVFIYLSKGYEIRNNIFFATPVSAGQPDSNEKVIECLENAKTQEERKNFYETYRQSLTPLPRNRIISFPEESGQGQVLEMDTNLSGAVLREKSCKK